MVQLMRLALIGLVLLVGRHAYAGDRITFRRPADDPNENSGVIRAVAFSPDGRLVAAAFGSFSGMLVEPRPGQAVVWDIGLVCHPTVRRW